MQVQNDVEAYIRQAALARGIDPDIAVRVANSEGGLKDPFRRGAGPAPKSQAKGLGATENSFGPLQLYISGTGAGLGDRALKAGIDPRVNWQGGVDFALDEVARDGWKQWYGAAKAGVGRWDGVKGSKPVGVTGGAPIDAFAGVNPAAGAPAAAGDAAAIQTAYAPTATPEAKSAAGLLAIQNLMSAGKSSPMPVPSLNPPVNEPSQAAIKQVAPPPPFAIDRPYGSMPEPASSLPSSIPDDPGFLERLMSGDVGGFREGVSGFEQGLGGQASRGTIPVPMVNDSASAGAGVGASASADLDPIVDLAKIAQLIDGGQGFGGIRNQAMMEPTAAAGAGTGAAASATATMQPAPFRPRLDIPPLAGATVPADGLPLASTHRGPTPVPQQPPIGPQFGPPMPQAQPQAFAQAPVNGGAAVPTPSARPDNAGFAPLPATGPKPTAKPANNGKKPFDTIGFLGALGSVMAALDQGSPELSGVSLSPPMHKPDFQGLTMPKGLL